MLVAGEALIQFRGTEPDFGSPAAVIQRYYETREPTLHGVGSYLMLLGVFALLWFICGLSAALRRPAGRLGWLPTVVLASGAVAVVAVMVGPNQWRVRRGWRRSG